MNRFKFDLTFLQSIGQQLLDGLLRATGNPIDSWSHGVRQVVVALFPLAELALAIGLALPKTRLLTLLLSLGMHLTLLVALGPWGLNHYRAVLGWNVYFILQNLLLFWPLPEQPNSAHRSEDRKIGHTPVGRTQVSQPLVTRLVTGLALFVLLAPGLAPLGCGGPPALRANPQSISHRSSRSFWREPPIASPGSGQRGKASA